VKTRASWVMDSDMNVKSYWDTYIVTIDGKQPLTIDKYDLNDDFNIIKITKHITVTIATIRDFETLILNMKPERRKMTMNLLSNLFKR
jgi:hypothetical protein